MIAKFFTLLDDKYDGRCKARVESYEFYEAITYTIEGCKNPREFKDSILPAIKELNTKIRKEGIEYKGWNFKIHGLNEVSGEVSDVLSLTFKLLHIYSVSNMREVLAVYEEHHKEKEAERLKRRYLEVSASNSNPETNTMQIVRFYEDDKRGGEKFTIGGYDFYLVINEVKRDE